MRNSDRWITPGVVIIGLLCATLAVLATIGGVAYLTARGVDPDPLLKMAAQAVTALGALGSFVVTLATRRTAAKTERNTGVLAAEHRQVAEAVYDIADTMPRPPAAPPRHSYPDTEVRPLVPPINGAAPAARGS